MKLNLSVHLLFIVMNFNPNNVVVVAASTAAAAESVPGLRGGSSEMNINKRRDHFTNDDITINNSLPTISFELVGYNEEDFNDEDGFDEDDFDRESSPSLLRGSRSLMTRDHFSNDDKIINNSPISFELLNYNEEARKVARLELQEALEAEYEHDVLVNNINEASQKNDDDDKDSSSSTFAINDSMDDIHGVELASTVIDDVGLLRSTEVVDEDVKKDVDLVHDLD
jgi:hypothetical protein